MDDDEFDSKYCVLVKIDPPMSAEDVGDEEFNCLEMYMENITGGNNSKLLKFNETRSYAIIKFEKPISDVGELQKKIDEKPLKDYRITVKTIPLVDRVLVTGLPVEIFYNRDDPLECELVLYFESKTFCPDGGEVKNLDVLPCQHAVVVQFTDHAVVQKLKADHKLVESRFTVRPLNIFESVEGPCCSVCNEVESADDMAEDIGEASWHSACEDTDSRKNEERSGLQSNSDTDEEMDTLKTWSMENKDTTSTQSRNEYSSFTSGKSVSVRKFTESDNSERTQLLLKTIKYKRIPGLRPEEHDMIKLSKSGYEIMGDDKKKADHIRKVTENVQGFGDVDLADYTVVAEKLNCSNGRKWMEELLDDLKIPAAMKHDKSTLYLSAISLELAKEAAKTVADSLLPARIKCDERQMSKCSKILQDKILMSTRKSGYLELLGLPMHVLRAVGEIEQKLHGRSWPIR